MNDAPTVLKGHRGSINTLSFTSDGSLLVSGSDDTTLRAWDLRPQTENSRIQLPPQSQIEIALFTQGGQRAVIENSSQSMLLCKVDAPISPCQPGRWKKNLYYNQMALSPDGTMIVARDDERWALWDISRPNSSMHHYEPSEGRDAGFANGASPPVFSHDGKIVAVPLGTVHSEKFVDLWYWEKMRQQPISIVLKFEPQSMVFSPNNDILATGDDEGNIQLWRVSTAAQQAAAIASLIVNDGSKPGQHSNDKTLELRFSPDGTHLLWMHENGTISIWKWREVGSVPVNISGCESSTRASTYATRNNRLELSPDGKDVACGGADGSLWIWRTTDLHAAPVILYPHAAPVIALFFDTTRGAIVTLHQDGAIVSSTSTDMLADLACKKVRRNLTPSEWADFVGTDISYEATCSGVTESPN